MYIYNGLKIQVAAQHRDISDVCCPFLIRMGNFYIPMLIGIHNMFRMSFGCMWAWHYGSKPHQIIIQPFYSLYIDLIAFILGQPCMHPWNAFVWSVHLTLLEYNSKYYGLYQAICTGAKCLTRDDPFE